MKGPVLRPSNLFSYPRSGSSWLCYVVEQLTGYKTGDEKHKLLNKTKMSSQLILRRSHSIAKCTEKRLEVLVRDYHEVLIRHPASYLTLEDQTKLVTIGEISYLNYLNTFHEWGKQQIRIINRN